jgi:hypothetical protein
MALGPLESASHLPADIVSLKKVSAAQGSMMFIGISCVMHTSCHVHNDENLDRLCHFADNLPVNIL